MYIAENLRRMRRERDLTQEELANFIGVSFQAVSKWERGEGYPDITFLPVLANFFETTIDALLGMDEMRDNAEIEKINDTADALVSDGKIDEQIELLRKAVQRFPGNYKLWSRLACALNFVQTDKETSDRNNKEAIEICERILARSTDSIARNNAQAKLCYLYDYFGEREKAAEIAKNLPYIWNCALIRADFLTGEDRVRVSKWNILHLVDAVDWQIYRLNKCDELSIDEKIAINHKSIAFFELLWEDGEYWHLAVNVAEKYRWLAQLYIKQGNLESALEMLEKSVPPSIMYDNQPEEAVYTSVLLRGQKFERKNYGKDYTESWCCWMLKFLEDPIYDVIRTDPRFIAVKNNLKEHANSII